MLVSSGFHGYTVQDWSSIRWSIVTIAKSFARRIISLEQVQGRLPEVVARCRVFPVEPLLRSNAMINPIATNGHKYLEPLLAHSGAPADSDGTKQPLLSETPYTPYSEQPALPEVPYKPYAEKPSHEAPYEPYKGI
jgi:hypothetical protein